MSNGGFDLLQSALHPMTCGGDRGDQSHRDYQAVHGGDLGELVQSDSGLVCPVCGWMQPEPLHVSQAAEIAQLKAELELTKKQRDQAVECGALTLSLQSIFTDADDSYRGSSSHYPDLYAHLAGRGK